MTIKSKGLHPKNIHNKQYDFSELSEKYPLLKTHLILKFENTTIDYSNPKSVLALNTALLYANHGIKQWTLPENNLCPPIPGRADYLYHLNDLLNDSKITKDINILDIGTGASCIYPLLGTDIFNWSFIATDINSESIHIANENINNNNLNEKISLRLQDKNENIIPGIIKSNDKFSASICNPPFYSSESEAIEVNSKKNNNLNLDNNKRNFSGKSNELWYKGGEKAFLHNYLYQSSLYKKNCFWYTSLVSKKENVKSMYQSLKKLGATDIKTIAMQHGNKTTRIVAWTFLNSTEKKDW